jgi:hypothetical protein
MKLNSIMLILIALLFASCKKQAGEGGTSSIKGKIWVEDWNTAFTIKNGEYAGADEDVYIIYGDDISYGEKTKANYNGEFEFKYLQKGNYKIYVYSKDKSFESPSGETSIVREISITKNKQTVDMETITIYN